MLRTVTPTELGNGMEFSTPSTIQPSIGLVLVVQMRPIMTALKYSQPPLITKGAWQNRSLFVYHSLHKQLLL